MLGWVRNLIGFYGARDLVGFDDFANVAAWLERGLARPAVQRGLEIRSGLRCSPLTRAKLLEEILGNTIKVRFGGTNPIRNGSMSRWD